MWSRPYRLLMLAMISWGLANPLSDIALEYLPVGVMFLVEVGTGTLILAAVAWRRGLRLGALPWRWVLLLGGLQPGITYLLGNVGYAGGTVVTGLVIMSSEVLILALLGWLLLGERIRPREGAALLVGFAGAVLVAVAATSSGLGTIASNLAFAGAATAAAGYAIAVRKLAVATENLDAVGLALGQALVSVGLAAVTAPFTWQLGAAGGGAPAIAWLAAAGAGAFGVALPFIWFAQSAAHIPARHAAIALNVIPVVGISIGALLGRGLPTSLQVVGGALVLASLFALESAQPDGAETVSR